MFGNLFIALLITILGSFLIYIFIRSAWEWSITFQISRFGKVQEADVINHRVDKGGRSNSYFISYCYYIDDRKYVNEQRISEPSFHRTNGHTQIEIAYLPRMPKFSRLTGQLTYNKFRNLLSVLGFAILVVEPKLALVWFVILCFCNAYLLWF